MQCSLLFSTFLSLGIVSASLARPESVRYRYARVGSVVLHLVVVNPEDPDVKLSVMLSQGGVGTAEAFRSILRRGHPTAAITGTFFSQKTLEPVGDIVVDGNLVHRGFIGTAVCWTWDNRIAFVDSRRGETRDWSQYEGVLCSGPRLLRNGRLALDPRAEGYRDRRLYRRASRTALALTARGKLLLACSQKPIYYRQMACALHRLGAIEAVGLDGGTSAGLFYRGKFLRRPGRWLTNILTVFDSRERYEQVQKGGSPHG